MKKIFLLLIVAFALNSCSMPEESSPTVFYQLVPIKSCRMPYRFYVGETYELEMFYRQPTSCHFYKGIYFEKEGNTRIVAIQCGVVESSNCVTYPDGSTATEEQKSAKCSFTPTGNQPYIFRFWTGKNEQGEDTYYDVEVPVEN
jgi:hypothetical protein